MGNYYNSTFYEMAYFRTTVLNLFIPQCVTVSGLFGHVRTTLHNLFIYIIVAVSGLFGVFRTNFYNIGQPKSPYVFELFRAFYVNTLPPSIFLNLLRLLYLALFYLLISVYAPALYRGL